MGNRTRVIASVALQTALLGVVGLILTLAVGRCEDRRAASGPKP
jgi:hypothetical protein